MLLLLRQDDAPSMDEFGDVLADMYAQSSSKQLALDRAVFRSLCDEVLTAQVRLPFAFAHERYRPHCFVCYGTDHKDESAHRSFLFLTR